MSLRHIARFDTLPVVGEHVTGTSEGPGYTATWSGTYEGVRASEHDGQPHHFLRDGEINGHPQGLHSFPVAHTRTATKAPSRDPKKPWIVLVKWGATGARVDVHRFTHEDQADSFLDSLDAEASTMTRAQAAAVILERQGWEDTGDRSDEEVIAAAMSAEGQPCNDCGNIVVWVEERGWWYHVDPSVPDCFLSSSIDSDTDEVPT